MRPKRRLRRVHYLLLALVGVYFGVCWALSGQYLSPRRHVTAPPDWMTEATWGGERCFVSARLAAGKPVPVVFVLAHGLGGDRSSFIATANTLDKAGYGVILPPMPGQDVNTEDRIGFGVEESALLAKIADEARRRPGNPKIIVGGVSMGGAAAWLATARTKTDGVITESAFADAEQAAEDFLNSRIKGGALMLRPVVVFGGWRSGIALGKIRPVDAARDYQGPSVVIHAGEDRTIPLGHGERLAEAARTELLIVPNVAHAYARAPDPESYDRRFLDLAARVLERP